MNKHVRDPREFGARYRETRNVGNLLVLTERMIADLSSMVGGDEVPNGVRFGAQIYGMIVRLEVAGLPDEFTFSNRQRGQYRAQAHQLAAFLREFMNSYNWVNPDDIHDCRFIASVFLMAEAEYRSLFWTPDVLVASRD